MKFDRLETTQVPLKDLNPYHMNPRYGNVKALEESLEVNGQYRAIVVNKGTKTGRPMEILAGNHTFKAARNLGWSTMACHVIDVDEKEATRILIVDNRAGELGGIDLDTVLTLTEINELDDWVGTGYTDEDIKNLLGDEYDYEEEEDDEEDEEPKEPTEFWVTAIFDNEEQQKEAYKVLHAEGYSEIIVDQR